jgi:hypothetical protein
MTFTEAAAEVLRIAGKPLHFKDITQLAIEKNLLSHVGKTPDVTMGARLSLQIKREPDGAIVRVKPGVFALREWEGGGKKKGKKGAVEREPEAAVEEAEAKAPEHEAADDDDSVADEVAALANEVDAADAKAATPRREPRLVPDEERPQPGRGLGDDSPGEDEEAAPLDEEERMRSELAASASDLFEEEDDDDQPLLGGPEPDAAPSEGGRRRRRRRRRGKGRDEATGPAGASAGTPGFGGQTTQVRLDDDDEDTIGVTIGDERDEQPTRRAIVLERVPTPQPQGRGRGQDYRNAPFARGGGGGGGGGQQMREPASYDVSGSAAFDALSEPLDEMSGRDLADVILQILAGADRAQGAVPFRSIAEAAYRRGKLSGDANAATAAVAAAVRGDNLRREAAGQRPRFRLAMGGRVAPSDWSLGPDLLRAESDLQSALERYRDVARRALASRLQKDMSGPALVELLLLALERLGFRDIRPVRRAGLPGGESHFSAIHVTAGDEIRTAIVLRRDGREIGRERVIDLRGSLHHYGPATTGWLITTGQCLSGAREEAAAPGTTPVALFDCLGFAKLLEENGVAVLSTTMKVPVVDIELLEALRGG